MKIKYVKKLKNVEEICEDCWKECDLDMWKIIEPKVEPSHLSPKRKRIFIGNICQVETSFADVKGWLSPGVSIKQDD